MRVRRSIIPRPCISCGRRTTNGSRCERCAAAKELERQARQPYRAAYFSVEYVRNRRLRIKRAGGRCEAAMRTPSEARCPAPAQEVHHVIPLSTARSYEEAIALCDVKNLRAVCWRHNPRGRNAA